MQENQQSYINNTKRKSVYMGFLPIYTLHLSHKRPAYFSFGNRILKPSLSCLFTDCFHPKYKIDVVRLHDVRQPVGDEDHRLGFRQPMNFGHDVVFALHIDVGGGLVEDIDRAVV